MSLTSSAGITLVFVVGVVSASIASPESQDVTAMRCRGLRCSVNVRTTFRPGKCFRALPSRLSARCFVKQLLEHLLHAQRFQNVLHGRLGISSNVSCR